MLSFTFDIIIIIFVHSIVGQMHGQVVIVGAILDIPFLSTESNHTSFEQINFERVARSDQDV